MKHDELCPSKFQGTVSIPMLNTSVLSGCKNHIVKTFAHSHVHVYTNMQL